MIDLNREKQHWIKDNFDQPITKTIMKVPYENCPWGTKIQKRLGCTCAVSSICSGFCTFPVNNSLVEPVGIAYNNFIEIPSANFDRELIAETDLDVSDDLEIYFVKNETEKHELSSNLIHNLSTVFNGIFEGFGGFNGETYSRPELLPKNNAELISGNFILNGYNIAQDSPFNVSHTIKSGTVLNGLVIDRNNANPTEKHSVLSGGYTALLRPHSWWSNTLSFNGTIRIKPKTLPTTKIDTVLKIASHFDYVETNAGFFKYQQESLHKSNIYSVKLINSGLNPNGDYFSKDEVIYELEKKRLYIQY